MEIEHEINQRPFKSGARTGQHGKACAGDFRRAIKVQDPESFADVPMGPGRGGQCWRRAPPAYLHILFGVSPDWDRRVGEIGNAEGQIVEICLDGPKGRFALRDSFTDRLHGRDGCIGRLFLAFQPGDLVGPFFQVGTQLLDLAGQHPSFLDEFAEALPLNVGAARAELVPDRVQIVSEVA